MILNIFRLGVRRWGMCREQEGRRSRAGPEGGAAQPRPARSQPYELYVPEQAAERMSWRTRREGDYLPSSGQSGRTKLKEIFIDHKIPAYQRNAWPLLLLDQEIIWAPMLKKATLAAVRGGKSVLIKVRHCDII